MRRLFILFSALLPAVLVAACSGGTSSPIANVPGGSAIPAARSGVGAARLLHPGHTPAYPPHFHHRHAITGAERARARAAGWTPLTNVAPWTNGAGTEMQMTDGTVLVQDFCTPNWFKLTPDKTGSYQNGTWTKVASMASSYGPLYFASAVLPDGKLIVNGGEYNECKQVETNLGAIYDPVANTWTPVTGPGWGEIGDGQSAVLPNGTYMLGNCCNSMQALLDESTMTWTMITGVGKHDNNSEEGWTLMKNGDLLVADVLSAPNSEVYNYRLNTWTSAGTVPVNLIAGAEIGPQTLTYNQTVWVAGATGASATYKTKTGTWVVGPSFPVVGGQQLDAADAPSTLMTNGTVMIPASPGLYNPPATFFVYNGRKLKQIVGPPGAPDDSSFNIRTLLLPTGQVLEDDGSNDVEVYAATGRIATSPPSISSVPTTLTHGSTYKIKGRRFNGASQVNMYGDDAQQATNYPLVRITNMATGDVFYARTHNHSFMGVGSNKQVSTMFDVPTTIETGASTLVVVTNGIVSAPVSVTIN